MDELRETFHDHPVYTLSEIAMSLHRVVERTYPQPYFIKAEILKLNFYPHSGHCYPELVEKEGKSIKSEMRAVIWASNFQRINERFQQIAGTPLKENISILCLASIEFSPKHGLALHIQDIEPTYTLGEMLKNRNAVIEQLKKEGVFEKNKQLPMPLLPKRIAVISVETSKGYSDFITTLRENRYGYAFVTELFPSILQGDKAITGMKERLSEIALRQGEFDCVVIVRGGGGDVGLSCYDDYGLAYQVATFPLPIFTGIGHSTNLSVTDMVAYTSNITPTDVAFSLLQYFISFDEQLQDLQRRMVEKAKDVLLSNRLFLGQAGERLAMFARMQVQQNRTQLQTYSEQLVRSSNLAIARQTESLKALEEKLTLLNPDNILKRGFSITRHNGKAVTSAAQLKAGDVLQTQLYEGEVTSEVKPVSLKA